MYWSPQEDAKSLLMFPDQLTWDQWVQAGNDTGSIWANPKFMDPEAGLYSLADDSPVWELGIEQIQMDNFGIQKN